MTDSPSVLHGRTSRLASTGLALAASLCLLGAGIGPAAAAGTSADAPFAATGSVSAEAAPPGGRLDLLYTVHVHPGHYVYREATTVTVTDAGGLKVEAPDYPKPDKHFDKWENKDTEVYTRTVTVRVPAVVPASAKPGDTLTARAEVRYRGCNPTTCFFPKTDEISLAVKVADAASPPSAGASPAAPAGGPPAPADAALPSPPQPSAAVVAAATPPPPAPASPPAVMADAAPADASIDERLKAWADGLSTTNFPLFLLIVFLGGLASSLTPCVYPMIPITVGVIGARAENSRLKAFLLSLVYVLGIAATYSVLGAVAAATGGLVGAAFQNPLVIATIAAFFFALALGMFGVYNFALPSGLVNRLAQVQGQGYAGAFVVGLVGGIVCSPCVGPVAGLVLGYMAQGEFSMAQGLLSMGVFSLGLGVLFIVVGTFSGAIAALPRSGAWMERVKYVFGFVMVGASVYYLGFLLPDVLTAALFAGLLVVAGITLGGLEPLPEYPGWGARFGKAFAVGLLLAGGLFALKATAGGRLERIEERIARIERSPAAATAEAGGAIPWMSSEPEAAALARQSQRPMMIDFTAEWCVACKELEHYTFTDPKVIDAARRFVPVTVDCTDPDPAVDEVKRRYGVVSLPTIVFVDSAGNPKPELTVKGFMKADEFLQRMRAATGGSTASIGGPVGG
ncbi:protein-disulfide reductase DsbD [Myxococcota bacterium]|nr:protein-disulfide reductase DsbD [Myxococcota bacterium]